MLVRQIDLHNFKAFYGTHLLELPAPSRKANVYLFGGENGAGKTTLVQAVLLALYGVGAAGMPGMPRQGRDFRRKYAEWLSASRNATARTQQEDLVTVGVLLEDQGRQISIKRSLWFRVDGSLDEELLELREDEGGHSELYSGDDAQDRVAVWIPRHLAELIFFDGEHVRTHLSDESGAIADALDRLLDLEPVKKLIVDIRRLSRDRRGSLLSEGQVSVLESWERELERTSVEHAASLREQAELSRQAEELEEGLSIVQLALDERLSGKSPMTTAQLDRELASLRQRRDELRLRFGRHLGEWFFLALAPDLVGDTVLDLQSQRETRLSRERLKLEAEATGSFAEELIEGLSPRVSEEALREIKGLAFELQSARASVADQSRSDTASNPLDALLDDELVHAETAAKAVQSRDDQDIKYLAEDLHTIHEAIELLEAQRLTIGSQGAVDRLVGRMHQLRSSLSKVRARQGAIEVILSEKQDELTS